MKKTFVLGLGAQKAGTTWLHRLLSTQEYSDFGFEKEYQMLHAMYEDFAEARRQLVLKEAIEKMEGPYNSWKGAPKSVRLSFLAANGSYFDYFASLLRVENISLTGDISPIYSALGAGTLSTVRREFERRSIAVLPILIMRDPVYRLQSYVRMSFRQRGVDPDYYEEVSAMRRFAGTPEDMKRVDYRSTCKAMEQVFPDTSLMFFFEDFFNEESISYIEERIGSELRGVNLLKRVGASKSQNNLTESDYHEFRSVYDDIYQFADQRWQDKVPWGFRSKPRKRGSRRKKPLQ